MEIISLWQIKCLSLLIVQDVQFILFSETSLTCLVNENTINIIMHTVFIGLIKVHSHSKNNNNHLINLNMSTQFRLIKNYPNPKHILHLNAFISPPSYHSFSKIQVNCL